MTIKDCEDMMSRHWVEIHQLNVGKLFLNVDAIDTEGFIKVWGTTYKNSVYLLHDNKINFALVMFENEDEAKEWFVENKQYWPLMWELSQGGVMTDIDPDEV